MPPLVIPDAMLRRTVGVLGEAIDEVAGEL
jgi:hypothetical protein